MPTMHHARVGCSLLEQGIDVLVEKPIAASTAEADLLMMPRRAMRSHPADWASGAFQPRHS